MNYLQLCLLEIIAVQNFLKKNKQEELIALELLCII